MTRAKPRTLLDDPELWGHEPDAPLRDGLKLVERGAGVWARWQNQVVCAVLDYIGEKRISRAEFARRAKINPGSLRQQLLGNDVMPLDNLYLCVEQVGRIELWLAPSRWEDFGLPLKDASTEIDPDTPGAS